MFAPRKLSSGAANCEFDKVDPSSAGYAITAVFVRGFGHGPARLIITTPDEANISLLTVKGAGAEDATALQRCPGDSPGSGVAFHFCTCQGLVWLHSGHA